MEIPNFNSLLEKSIIEHWDNDALTDYKGVTLQYKDVARKIEKLHIMFENSGVEKGDKIALCGRNSANWAVAFIATLTYGAIAVPILHEFMPDQVHNIVNHSEAKLLFVGDVVATTIDATKMPGLEGIIYIPDYSLVVSRTDKLTYARELLLEHITAISGRQRIKGFTDTIAGHPEYRIVGSGESDGQIENAMPVMEKLLEEHPETNVVMALNDPSAFGAMAAIEGVGLSGSILIYSVDGSPEAKAMVSEHMMTATCAQFPSLIALEAAKALYEIRSGIEVEKKITTPVELVTEKNVYRFDLSGWQ